MIARMFVWCMGNIKSTLAIIAFLITMIFVPTIKEGIAFINAGYQSTKDNARQDRQIEFITTSTIETKTSVKNIEKMILMIQNRDYDELREARRNKR